jgi:hypothetical protein
MTAKTQWINTKERLPKLADLDIEGKVWVHIKGNTIMRMEPRHMDRTVTHWMPTNLTSSPTAEAEEWFCAWWEEKINKNHTHRAEAKEAYLACYEKMSEKGVDI